MNYHQLFRLKWLNRDPTMKKLLLVFFACSTLFYSQISYAELSLNDLTFKHEELKVDPQILKVMEERHSKLQLHQKLGLATMAAMTATVILGGSAKDNNVHKYAGITTGLLYWTTAYFAWTAPKPEGIKDTGSTEIHRALAWIHVPLMTITPILGYLAKEDANKGKESTGIVKAHGGIATAAYLYFIAPGITMYFDF
jgi:cytochrome b561